MHEKGMYLRELEMSGTEEVKKHESLTDTLHWTVTPSSNRLGTMTFMSRVSS